MARLSRIVVPGYPHHVTRRGVRSIDVFHSEEDRGEYLGMLGEEIVRHGVSILVWCLMTNHVHFVAVPQREASLARAFDSAHRPGPEQGTTREPPKAPAVKNGIVSPEFYRILKRFSRVLV
jgi:putative transposase